MSVTSNVTQSVPSAVQASTNYEYVSTLDLTVGIHEPTVGRELVKRFGNQMLTGLMDMIGNKEEVFSREFHHYEEDFIHSKVYFDTKAAGSAGASQTLTVSASSPDYQYDYATSAVPPYQQAGNYKTNPVRVNDILLFSDGTQGFVTAVNYATGVVTVWPESDTAVIPAVGTDVSNEVAIISNAMEEDSSARTSQNSRTIRYSNNTQVIRETHKITGNEKNVKMWFEVDGKRFWYVKGIEDTYKRFLNQIEMALVVGKQFTNTGITNYGTMTTTQGLLPSIETAGIVLDYGASVALTDIDDVTAEMDKFRTPEENALMLGFNINASIDDLLRTSTGMTDGGIIYSAVGGEEKAVNFGFRSFTKNGYTFHKKLYKPFTHPELLGADGQAYPNLAFSVPLGNTVTSRDMSGTPESVPMLSCAYMKHNDGQSNYYHEWETGSLFGKPTNDEDSSKVNFLADVGLWAKALNRYTIWKKS